MPIYLSFIYIALLAYIFSLYACETMHLALNFFFHAGCDPLQRKLKSTAVPSVFAWTCEPSSTQLARQCRALRRTKVRSVVDDDCITTLVVSDASDNHCNIHDLPVMQVVEIEGTVQVADETVPGGVSLNSSVQTDSSRLLEISIGVQTERQPLLTLETCASDDETIHFYTGLESYSKVKFVLATLGPAAYCLKYMYGSVSGISVSDQFFLVLMKLRQHKTNFELSKLFCISESDVYNIFSTWIRFMSLQWGEVDIWPPQDLVRFYTPTDFKSKFPTTRVIIDGTECPVKKPALPLAQQSTFSSYKNRNTVKVLVGATPSGMVSYVSPAYGGSTSDRQIVERSDLPRRCDIGDSVMADKGFDVQDLFAARDVTVNIPTFFRKKNQMSSKKVMHDRKVSSKRVHIERIIGLGKTYKILTHPLNTSETALSSDIIKVCYMLCNFKKCIVPRDA
jgi:hypothetical protein